MIKQRFFLVNDQVRERAASAVLNARDDWMVEIRPRNRTLDQNALLHAVLSDIAKQVEWHGQKLTIDIWKRLCTAAWLREEKQSPMMIPAIDGNGFDVIFERTSKLNVKQCSRLIEWCFAFGAESGVLFQDRTKRDYEDYRSKIAA